MRGRFKQVTIGLCNDRYWVGLRCLKQVLLDRGLDEQHRDNAGWGPLHYASFEGHSSIVKLLSSAGWGRLARWLHICVILRAELDMTDCDGKTALHLSCSEVWSILCL